MIRRHATAAACLAALSLAAAACSSGSSSGTESSAAASVGATSTKTSGGSGAPLADLLPAEIRSAGTIVVGSELTVPPMTFYQQDGKTIEGVNYDLAEAMGKQLGVTFEFRQLAFPGLQPALRSGKIDVVLDVINDTKERQQVMDFVDYVKAGNTLLVKGGNPAGIKAFGDMCGHSIATVRGAVQADLVKAESKKCQSEGKKPITLNLYPSAPEARLQVQTGKSTAFIGNTPVLVYLAKTAGDGKTFEAVPLKDTGSYYGIAVDQSDKQLRDALEKALGAVMKDGTYTKILDKYGVGVIAMKAPKVNAATS